MRECKPLSKKPWSGRFQASTDSRVETFTASISIDSRLFKQDIQVSIAHARMLAHIKLLTSAECQQIERALLDLEEAIEDGSFILDPALEDIHMNIEAAITAKLGDIGQKLHTARSRNDQVSTALKLWLRDALDVIDEYVTKLQTAIMCAAVQYRHLILPGYTHLQRAQPVLAAHIFLAYIEKLERDRLRIADCRRRLNELPLGSAALAGTSLQIDRSFLANELDFDEVAVNSLDASGDRDFVLESVFVLTLIAEHLAGLAEDWILWSTQEFGFLSLPDGICTGSSIMPQKKNPDVLELIRGRTARVIGDLATLLVLIKGLPLAYNRDLQEDKEPLFNAFDTVKACLELATVTVDGMSFRIDQIDKQLDDGFLDATTVMEFLIERGVPLCVSHEVVGRLVGSCERRGLTKLADLSDPELAETHPELGPRVRTILGAAEYNQGISVIRLNIASRSTETPRVMETETCRKG